MMQFLNFLENQHNHIHNFV